MLYLTEKIKCVSIYVMTLFRSDGDASGSDAYPVCNVFERTNWQCNYVCTVEEGIILTETRNDAEICDKSDNESIMMSEQDMENINSGDESDHDIISTEMLEDICDGSQTHTNDNIKEARYKIHIRISQR